MEGGGGVQQVGMISDVGKEVFCIREMVFSAEQTWGFHESLGAIKRFRNLRPGSHSKLARGCHSLSRLNGMMQHPLK